MTITLILIITIALIVVVIYIATSKHIPFRPHITTRAALMQTSATIALLLLTGIYVNEVKQSRLSQEQGFNEYVEEIRKSRLAQKIGVNNYMAELQKARKQQVMPSVYAFFHWTYAPENCFLILKNIGVGPAFDINYSYSVVDDNGRPITGIGKCGMLGAGGKERCYGTSFLKEHKKLKNKVEIEISYTDSFGEIITNNFEHNLKELANHPLPSEFAERRTEHLSRLDKSFIEASFNDFFNTFHSLQKDISEIKDSIKKNNIYGR